VKKWSLALALTAIVTGLFIASAEAVAPKPGAVCTKLNQTQVAGGYTYTCIKAGKKLIWSQGLKGSVPLPMPSPSQSASKVGVSSGSTGVVTLFGDCKGFEGMTSTTTSGDKVFCRVENDGNRHWVKATSGQPVTSSTPTQSVSPSTTNSPSPAEPKTLDDLIAHPEAAPYWAWEKSKEQLYKSVAVGPPVTVIVGPHTIVPSSLIQSSINVDSKFYENFIHPTSVVAIYFNFGDVAWAQKEWEKVALHPTGDDASKRCPSVAACGNAMTEIDLKGKGLLFLSVSSGPDPDYASGLVEAHEYIHAIQAQQFVGTSKEDHIYCCIKTYMPAWMVEGNAHFTSVMALHSNSYAEYSSSRKNYTYELLANQAKTFTKSWLQNYLDTTNQQEWYKPENRTRMYDVGYLVNEVLCSLKGPSVNMQLFKDVANGKTWEQAFEADLGISWSEALPKLATILSEMINN